MIWDEATGRDDAEHLAEFARAREAVASLTKVEGSWAARLDAEWKVRYCLALRTTGSRTYAAHRARVSPVTVTEYTAADPVFAACIQEAKDAATDRVEAAILLSATVGDPEPIMNNGEVVGQRRRKSEKAAEIYLRAKRPAEYRPDGVQQVAVVALPTPDAVAGLMSRIAGVIEAPMEITDSVEKTGGGGKIV